MKKNDILTLDITDITNLGFGVARHEGLILFVSDAVPGDRVSARVIKLNKSYAICKAEKHLILSSIRTDERCSEGACKSCAYKALRYENELLLKYQTVCKFFSEAGLSELEIMPVCPSPMLYGYRNKAQYPVSIDKNGRYLIGFYAPKSHRVTEARRCKLAPDAFGDILDACAKLFEKHNISVYSEESGKGLLRHIYLRRGETTGEILLTFVINGSTLPFAEDIVSSLTESFPKICGILTNENTENTNVILGDRFQTLWGRDFIYDTLAGVILKISAPAFYQVNRSAAELIYRKALELAEPKKSDTLLDLYCGAGSIGLSMASRCKRVVGIEIIDSAIECARENAIANNISNASFYTGDAADCERLLDNAEKELGEKLSPDIIILDPPRGGCDERLIKYTASLSPRKIVYISCNPATLARDTALFKSLGYLTNKVYPYDLFPGTGHVETVILLSKGVPSTK